MRRKGVQVILSPELRKKMNFKKQENAGSRKATKQKADESRKNKKNLTQENT